MTVGLLLLGFAIGYLTARRTRRPRYNPKTDWRLSEHPKS